MTGLCLLRIVLFEGNSVGIRDDSLAISNRIFCHSGFALSHPEHQISQGTVALARVLEVEDGGHDVGVELIKKLGLKSFFV